MKIVRYESREGLRMGLWIEDKVIDLTRLDGVSFRSFVDLAIVASGKKTSLKDVITECLHGNLAKLPRTQIGRSDKLDANGVRFVVPLDPPEVWGCGITYEKSRVARETETGVKGVYDLAYAAKRPEVFFKATSSRYVGPDEEICVRGDSKWSVPEAELAFILGPDNAIVGFTAGNDVTARDIEGENPLYLPQAKIYKGCCALAPSIVTIDEVGLEPRLEVKCQVFRAGESIFLKSFNTSRMKRSIEELRSFLCRYNPMPVGTTCLTGTGIVPPDDFSLQENDTVEIEIEKIGTLRNRVRRLETY